MNRFFVALALPLLLGAACNKAKPKTIKSATNQPTKAPNGNALDDNGESTGALSQTPPVTQDEALTTPRRETFAPIYFGYDASSLSPEAMRQLDALGEYLEAHPEEALIISGHTDDRGTEEYNLALSDQRALAAKDYLTRLRIDPARIALVPYGEELPSLGGSNEESWSKNRRDEFKLVQKTAGN